MTHLNEMRNFIKVVGSSVDEEDLILESIDDLFDGDSSMIVEELERAVFKLDSYGGSEHNADYTRGLQEGLNYAIIMLSRIIDSHKG